METGSTIYIDPDGLITIAQTLDLHVELDAEVESSLDDTTTQGLNVGGGLPSKIFSADKSRTNISSIRKKHILKIPNNYIGIARAIIELLDSNELIIKGNDINTLTTIDEAAIETMSWFHGTLPFRLPPEYNLDSIRNSGALCLWVDTSNSPIGGGHWKEMILTASLTKMSIQGAAHLAAFVSSAKQGGIKIKIFAKMYTGRGCIEFKPYWMVRP